MKRIKVDAASQTKQVEVKDAQTWQERVLANMGHLSAEDQAILRKNLPTDAEIAAMEE